MNTSPGLITTVTLNPMVDKTVTLPKLLPGRISRAGSASAVVGGKGINVSRQVRQFGLPTLATGFVGGETGLTIERLLHEEGVPFDFVRVAGMTREGVTYREADGTVTSVFEPPPQVSEEEVNRLLEKASLLVPRSSWLVCAGSSPCPSADGLFRDILQMCSERKIPAVLDSYGLAFSTSLGSRPTLVKPNKQECELSLGKKLEDPEAMANLAAELVREGITYAVITDGPHPFAAADRLRRWIVNPPQVTTVNPTGSGDSMVAAMINGLSKGWPFEQCLAFGAAAGAVNARVWQVAAAQYQEVLDLARDVEVRIL